jgi:16S rRNA (guanine966-N2)-methyltransferase
MRIGSGKWRNAMLPAAGTGVRPISSRLRQSLFTVLSPWVEGAAVLDLCAGVGTLGLEALSRGAARVVLVERDRRQAALLDEWIADRHATEAKVVEGDARGGIWPDGPYDLVFLDPPFDLHEDPDGLRPFLERAIEDLAVEGVIAVKLPTDATVPADPRWVVRTRRGAGDVAYALVTHPTP